jgi:threonine/homoserine/homoserine lactone efflux protein
MALHTWLLYLAAAIGLSLTPGPNSLLVLTHGALHGHRRTLFTVAGGATGFTLLIGLSMLGIGALLQASASALTLLKWLGGAYLVWLGVQLWRAPAITLVADAGAPHAAGSALFRQGLLTAISNPKALLFYGAFLPQFIDLTAACSAVRGDGPDLRPDRVGVRVPAGTAGACRAAPSGTGWPALQPRLRRTVRADGSRAADDPLARPGRDVTGATCCAWTIRPS